MLVFAEGGKTLGTGTRTNNKLNPHMTPSTGIEPGTHWWEAAWEVNAQPLCHPCSLYVDLKPAAHERKELRKLPREVISSAVQLTCAVEFLWEFRLARPWGKYLTCLIFEISPREAKFSQKLNHTLEETTELITSRGSLLSSFLSCAAGSTIWHYKISLICRRVVDGLQWTVNETNKLSISTIQAHLEQLSQHLAAVGTFEKKKFKHTLKEKGRAFRNIGKIDFPDRQESRWPWNHPFSVLDYLF